MDDETWERLIRLAGIRLPEFEAPGLRRDMERILAFFEDLGDQDAGDDEPPSREPRALRADRPEPSSDRDALMDNTAHREAGCYRVPRMRS